MVVAAVAAWTVIVAGGLALVAAALKRTVRPPLQGIGPLVPPSKMVVSGAIIWLSVCGGDRNPVTVVKER